MMSAVAKTSSTAGTSRKTTSGKPKQNGFKAAKEPNKIGSYFKSSSEKKAQIDQLLKKRVSDARTTCETPGKKARLESAASNTLDQSTSNPSKNDSLNIQNGEKSGLSNVGATENEKVPDQPNSKPGPSDPNKAEADRKKVAKVSEQELMGKLKSLFGFNTFKCEIQKKSIKHILLRTHDIFVSMPTGKFTKGT